MLSVPYALSPHNPMLGKENMVLLSWSPQHNVEEMLVHMDQVQCIPCCTYCMAGANLNSKLNLRKQNFSEAAKRNREL